MGYNGGPSAAQGGNFAVSCGVDFVPVLLHLPLQWSSNSSGVWRYGPQLAAIPANPSLADGDPCELYLAQSGRVRGDPDADEDMVGGPLLTSLRNFFLRLKSALQSL